MHQDLKDNKRVVIFDVGRTLVSITHKDILQFFVKNGVTNILVLSTVRFLFFIHKVIGINDKLVCLITTVAFKIFKGQDHEKIKKMSKEFFENEFKNKMFSYSINKIKEHVDNGDEVILLSALFPEIIVCAKDFFGLQLLIVPNLEIIDGKYTGRVIGEIPYGRNKAKLVQKMLQKSNLNLDDSYAYSDRISDIPLFEIVKNPIVVNPEPRLIPEAQKRGWLIINP